jgi:uncharacterized membrane protein
VWLAKGGRLRASVPSILTLLVVGGLAVCGPARAQLIACNKSPKTIWFAVGRLTPAGNSSSGWMIIKSGRCAPLLALRPEDRTVYGYMDSRPGMAGGDPARDPLFCVNWRPFKEAAATPNCPHGFDTRAFFPIPTAGRSQYTLTVGSRRVDVPLVNPPPPDPPAP